MAEVLCQLKKKSGGGSSARLVDILLWSNSSPTSAFGKQSITLSESISNYDFIKIKYRASTDQTKMVDVIMMITEYKKTSIAATGGICPALSYFASNGIFCRPFGYSTDTSISFGNSNHAGGTDSNNSCAIPVAIYGVKLENSAKIPLYIKNFGVRSYTGNTATVVSIINFDIEDFTKITINSRDSALTSAVIRYYNGDTNLSTVDIPTSGIVSTIPSNATRFAILASRTGASGSNIYYIHGIEVS